MKLPSIEKLANAIIWFAGADLLYFFYSGSQGFSHSQSVVVVFTWLAVALLFVAFTMVLNGYLIRRELLVYFLSLYIRLFALAFQLIALGIGISHSSTASAVFSYITLALLLVSELITYGFLLVQLDDMSSVEPEAPTDIEGAGILTNQLNSVNSWTASVCQFLLVFVPFYGPLLKMGIGKKSL